MTDLKIIRYNEIFLKRDFSKFKDFQKIKRFMLNLLFNRKCLLNIEI